MVGHEIKYEETHVNLTLSPAAVKRCRNHGHDDRFFAYSALNINFKGVHMKLKIVGLSVE